MYWPTPTWRWMMVPPIGASTSTSGLAVARLGVFLQGRDLGIGLAEDAQAAAHGAQRDIGGIQAALRGGEVHLALLPVLQRPALGVVQIVRALLAGLRHAQLGAGGAQRGDGGDQVVLRLHELAGLDGEQRLALLHDFAGLGDDLGDAAGIGREHRRVEVVVDGDHARRCAARPRSCGS